MRLGNDCCMQQSILPNFEVGGFREILKIRSCNVMPMLAFILLSQVDKVYCTLLNPNGSEMTSPKATDHKSLHQAGLVNVGWHIEARA